MMRILVIDPDPTLTQTLNSLSSPLIYDVDRVTEAEMALQRVKAMDYDVILIDKGLAGEDGLSLCRQLRSQGFSKRLLVLTDQEDPTETAIALGMGAEGYLPKGLPGEVLLSRLQILLLQQDSGSSESEDFFETIYNCSGQAIFVIEVIGDDDFRYLCFNSLAESYSGLKEEQIQGKTPEEAFGNRSGSRFRQNYQTCCQMGTTISYEEYIVFGDRTLWTITTLTPLYNSGKIYRIIGTAIDISDRKQIDLTLQGTEHQLRLFINSAPVAVALFDRNMNYLAVSQRWIDIYHLDSRENLLNHSHYATFPNLPERWREVHQQGLGGAVVRCDEDCFTLPDGSVQWLKWTVHPWRLDTGEVGGIIIFFEDISDIKQAQMALQKQIRQEYLLSDIAQDIRHSLNLDEVLSRTVDRVRDFLATDRVIIFRFRPDWRGDVVTESVGERWLSLLSTTIFDPCFRDHYVEPYRQGRIAAMSDIEQEDLEPCYVDFLKSFEVKANLVVPIFQGEHLWGLVIAHHCASPRQWQPAEIALLRRLATQVGIAIQQSELYEQTRRELLERQRMQSILMESEEKFRSLSSSAPIGICQTNADGICLYSNVRWREMSGLDSIDSLGHGWLEGVHPEDRERVRRAWEDYLAGEGDSLSEFRLLTPVDEIHWVSAQVAPMISQTGEILGHVLTYEDITERKRSEDRVRQSEQQLQAILDHAPAFIYLIDPQNRYLLVNRRYAELVSTTVESIIGKSIYDYWPSKVADAFALENRQVMERGQLVQTEQVIPQSDGNHTYMSLKFPLYNESGELYAVCGIATDITEKKQLEAQFYRAQRLESIGTLASGIAHDFNNLLTPILAVAQLLSLKLPNLDEKNQEMLRILQESARQGANLVKQVLSFSRGTEDKRVIIQVEHLLTEVVKIAQRTFPKSIEIKADIPRRELWTILADTTQIHQVFMNLIINARDAMPDGGTLTIAAENRHLDDNYARMNLEAHVGGYVVVTVSDTGTGIPPEFLERIFDPFFTTKEVGKGSGLGLATVLGIVKNHGGFVKVYSEVELGSRFQVFLPANNGKMSLPQQEEELTRGNGELILIVDDDPIIRQITQTSLEDYNYRTLLAEDGIEALSLYVQHQGEIARVLMDLMMPNLDGISTIRTLQKINPQVKVVVTSGLPFNPQLLDSVNIQGFLLKPYTLRELLESIVC